MIIIRNLGDYYFIESNNQIWTDTILLIKALSKIFLTMAMAAIGLSTNFRDIKSIGYKPFVVGLIGMTTVGIVSIFCIEIFTY